MTQSARLATADLEMLLLSRLFVARVGELEVLSWCGIDDTFAKDCLHAEFQSSNRERVARSQ
jgi:hypothetical protein